MAITRQKTDSLVEANLNVAAKDIDPNNLDSNKKVEITGQNSVKKPNFLQTTIEELKLVKWPTWQYVYKWSSIILLFTFVMSIGLGFFDKFFTTGVKFVDCTSIVGKKQTVGECGTQFWADLTN
jgi:preprotein translocase SecE subunit